MIRGDNSAQAWMLFNGFRMVAALLGAVIAERMDPYGLAMPADT